MQKRILTFLLTALIISFSSNTKAMQLETDSKINEVTVFTDRAKITRSAKLNIVKGKHSIIFNNLPANLITSSLKVDGKAIHDVIIGSVESKRIAHRDLVKEDEKTLQDKIELLRDKINLIDAEIRALAKREDFINNIGKTAPNTINEDIKRNEIKPDIWVNAWQTIENGALDTFSRKLKKEAEKRDINKEISQLQRELNNIRTGRKDTLQVKVNIEAEKATEFSINLSYIVYGASWNPIYDARLDTKKQTLNIVQFGQVRQGTGEDWENVKLTLSTAKPSQSAEMPNINTWWINIYSPHRTKSLRMYDSLSSTDGISQNMQKSEGFVGGAMELEEAKMPAPRMARRVSAKLNNSEYSAEFEISGLSSVSSDNSNHKFNIINHNMETELVSRAVPKYDTKAYLYAFGTYKEEAPLMAGKVSLFRDDAFIGNTYIKTLRQNETAKLAFGIDDKIIIKRKKLSDEKSELGVIAKQKQIHHHFITEIENLHNKTVKLNLFDSIPVAKNKDISISLIEEETTPNYEKDVEKRVGVLLWRLEINPSEKKDLSLGYTVSYPIENDITGM